MEIGYIGLGKMGYNMTVRLVEYGHEVFAYDTSEEARQRVKKRGVRAFSSLEELAGTLEAPRVVWLMVPDSVVDDVLADLVPRLFKGDIVIDGGNSYYKDSMRRAKELNSKGFKFLDVGVSGGPGGARHGACVMVGGEKEVYEKLEPLFIDVSVEAGYAYLGGHGAGHFAKMVHNGIEYGMMQSLAEGFSILKNSGFSFDLKKVADLYNHGSVVESRLLEWLKEGFEKFGPDMEGVSGVVGQSGEGEWTSKTAKEMGLGTQVIDSAVKFRVDSKANPSYTGKLLSAMRNMFGGHKYDINY